VDFHHRAAVVLEAPLGIHSDRVEGKFSFPSTFPLCSSVASVTPCITSLTLLVKPFDNEVQYLRYSVARSIIFSNLRYLDLDFRP
jgi:hypothetical protein